MTKTELNTTEKMREIERVLYHVVVPELHKLKKVPNLKTRDLRRKRLMETFTTFKHPELAQEQYNIKIIGNLLPNQVDNLYDRVMEYEAAWRETLEELDGRKIIPFPERPDRFRENSSHVIH